VRIITEIFNKTIQMHNLLSARACGQKNFVPILQYIAQDVSKHMLTSAMKL